jgi:hypothetical protein
MADLAGPTLSTYVETRFSLMEETIKTRLTEIELRHQQRWEATEKAILKAETASEKRFESVNEFRATLADQQRTFMPRAEVEVMRDAMGERVGTMKEQLERLLAERRGVGAGWGYAAGVVGLIVSLLMVGLRLAGK